MIRMGAWQRGQAWTEVNGSACSNDRGRSIEQLPAQRQKQTATAIGKKAEVANTWEAAGQPVLQKAA
jgi:hypothetical protein